MFIYRNGEPSDGAPVAGALANYESVAIRRGRTAKAIFEDKDRSGGMQVRMGFADGSVLEH